MSDLAMYEALADAAIRRCRNQSDRLQKVETHFLLESDHAATPECRAGFDLVLKRIRDAIAQLNLPLEEGR